jgi:hypothetical protein
VSPRGTGSGRYKAWKHVQLDWRAKTNLPRGNLGETSYKALAGDDGQYARRTDLS